MKHEQNDHQAAALGDDLLWGLKPIAHELGLTPRQAANQIQTRRLPVSRLGGKLVASRSGLRRHFAQVLNGEVA